MQEKDYVINQPFDVESLDYEKEKPKIFGIKEVAHAKKMCFFVFDYYKHNYFYIKSFNEYFNEIPKKIREPYLFFNLKVFSEDRLLVKQIHHRGFRFIFSQKLKDRKNAILRYNCRFQNKNGEYPMTEFTLKMLETDKKGAVWLVLFLIEKSISDYYFIPNIEIGSKKKPFLFDLNKSHLDKLTEQEKIIAKMLFEDMSHYEIADKINRSLSTIRTHIRNMYKKFKVNNEFSLKTIFQTFQN